MKIVWALRSLLFVLWMAATVVPWAILMLLLSIAVRGERLYWPTMQWLRMAIWGARVICGIRPRVQGLEHLPTAAEHRRAVAAASSLRVRAALRPAALSAAGPRASPDRSRPGAGCGR